MVVLEMFQRWISIYLVYNKKLLLLIRLYFSIMVLLKIVAISTMDWFLTILQLFLSSKLSDSTKVN